MIFPGFVIAQPYPDRSQDGQIHLLGRQIYLLEDAVNQLEIKDVIIHNGFRKGTETIPNLGITSSYWVKIPLHNQTSIKEFFLVLPYATIDEVKFYRRNVQGSFDSIITGDKYPFSSRQLKHPYFLFKIPLLPGEKDTCYLKVSSDDQVMLPLYIAGRDEVNQILREEHLVFGIFFGILLVMCLYNFFIYLSVKDKTYLYYILYVFFIGLTQASIFGYTAQFIFPEYPYWSNKLLLFSAAFGGIFVLMFASKFLSIPEYIPSYKIIQLLFTAFYLIAILFAFLDKEGIAYRIIDYLALFLGPYIIYTALKISLKGKRSARYFLVGWTIALIGFSMFSSRNLGVLPFSNLTNYTMPFGIALETIIFSWALADRINLLKKENELKQKEIIRHLQENEKILMATKESELLVERLKKESLDSQFESLKNQVNPHFLFNSLNVLSELINQNQVMAIKFVKELSDVYRYVLDSKNKEIVDLNSELKFIEAFVYLLKFRFDSSLKVDNQLKGSEKIAVPPLAIQLLLENAIKHNVISEKEPLTIQLYHEDDYIVVRNTINLKKHPQKPSGIGLKNLESRYEFLTDKRVLLTSDKDFFTVKIPILSFH